jgi:hypothetical protein
MPATAVSPPVVNADRPFVPHSSTTRNTPSPANWPRGNAPPSSGAARHSPRFPDRRAGAKSGSGGGVSKSDDHEILFQKFFKSVGPRTYAAQVKRARNGNHYLVLMEGKRDGESGDVRKTRLFIYSEDFVEFFRLIKSAAEFIKATPLPAVVQKKRDRYWAKQAANADPPRAGGSMPSGRPSPRPTPPTPTSSPGSRPV